jgi:molecular chaperone HtpG
VEVLLFSDPVDEVWLHNMPSEYRGKTWQSVGKGEIDLGSKKSDEEGDEDHASEADATFDGLVGQLHLAIEDQVKEVRISRRLTSSPACLVSDEGDLSPQIEAMLRQAGQEIPDRKPILEVNPDHPLLVKLQEVYEGDADASIVGEYAELLYSQALLAEGGQLVDPAEFGRKLAALMVRAL